MLVTEDVARFVRCFAIDRGGVRLRLHSFAAGDALRAVSTRQVQ